jgi:murein DD-endopeptidase MepM/ murein hydrolase activator NlpD
MTSPFGFRHHPIYGCARLHRGCDFTTPEGTRVFATADGTVASSDWLGGYGKVVEIDHGFGLRTLYAHCGDLLVKKGQQVERGQLIATVGMTGLTSGPHCHYEVHKNGEAVDPSSYLKAAYKSPPSAARFSRRWLLDFFAECR